MSFDDGTPRSEQNKGEDECATSEAQALLQESVFSLSIFFMRAIMRAVRQRRVFGPGPLFLCAHPTQCGVSGIAVSLVPAPSSSMLTPLNVVSAGVIKSGRNNELNTSTHNFNT